VVEVPTPAQTVKIPVSFLFLPNDRLTPTVPEEGSFKMARSRPHPSQSTTTALSTGSLKTNLKMPAPKFLTLRLKNTEKTMKDVNPFCVKQGLDLICGKVKNVPRLRNGTLLVEAITENQSNALLKVSLLGSYLIQVERHASLNSSRGVVSTDALDGLSDEAVQSVRSVRIQSL
jgi:hypothetical protein